jgi:hypothetical protein
MVGSDALDVLEALAGSKSVKGVKALKGPRASRTPSQGKRKEVMFFTPNEVGVENKKLPRGYELGFPARLATWTTTLYNHLPAR